MDNLFDLQRLIKDYVTPLYQNIMMENIKQGICFEPIEGGISNLGVTKFGGIPDVPPNFSWPTHKNDIPFTFLMQINLSEVSNLWPQNPLPKDGILYFFISSNLNEATVLYEKSIDSLRPANLPIFEKPKISFFQKFFSSANEFKLFKNQFLNLKIDYSIPKIDSLLIQKISKEMGIDLIRSLLPNPDFVDLLYSEAFNPKHHLLGHYYSSQDGIYEYTLEHTYKYIEKIELSDLKKSIEWTFLLKLESDERLGFNVMDAGSLLFFIHKNDLEKGDFSKVRVTCDST